MNLSEYSSGWAPSVPREDSFVLGEGLYGHYRAADASPPLLPWPVAQQ